MWLSVLKSFLITVVAFIATYFIGYIVGYTTTI